MKIYKAVEVVKDDEFVKYQGIDEEMAKDIAWETKKRLTSRELKSQRVEVRVISVPDNFLQLDEEEQEEVLMNAESFGYNTIPFEV